MSEDLRNYNRDFENVFRSILQSPFPKKAHNQNIANERHILSLTMYLSRIQSNFRKQ